MRKPDITIFFALLALVILMGMVGIHRGAITWKFVKGLPARPYWLAVTMHFFVAPNSAYCSFWLAQRFWLPGPQEWRQQPRGIAPLLQEKQRPRPEM